MNLKLKGKIVEKFGSQSRFAQVAEVDETLVSRVVHGYRKLDMDEQIRWAAILDTDRGVLFGPEA